jgi:pimeloyl-ACP methyl ester carboxylesterase
VIITKSKAIALLMSAVVALAVAVPHPPARAAGGGLAKGIKNVVLVHGAFADGSSWAKVIPLLQAKGYNVTAVQIPLTALHDDVAVTKRALDRQDGRVLLVGHSWAGVVITQAGTDPKVAGLVYVNAFAPSEGQSVGELGNGYPSPPGIHALKQTGGFLWLPAPAVAEFFAPDLPRSETDVMAATEGPIAAASFGAKVSAAAWRAKPSWYIVGSRDQMIDPGLERAMAKKIKAKTLELPSSHVPMLSHPDKVASFIAAAASSL